MHLATALLLGIIGGADSSDEAVVCISADTLPVCTGTLVGAHTVLTAGHCAAPLGDSVTYFANIGPDCRHPHKRARISEFATHPRYTSEGNPFDLAAAHLAAALDVTALEVSADAVDAGASIRHVGYGVSDESKSTGWGTQRAVTHAVTRVDGDFVYSGDAAANTCAGDSGGPTFSGSQIVAVISDGPDCHSESRDVWVDRAWLDERLEAWDPPQKKGCGCSEVPVTTAVLLLWTLARVAKTTRP